MALLSGCIYVKSIDKLQIIEPCRSYDASVHLSKKYAYLIGIDQSTSCTGFFIMNTNMTLFILLEFKRDSNDKEVFYRDLEGFLRELLDGVKVTMVIHEEPVPSKIAPSANAILTELKGRLRSWISSNPALQGAEVHSIYPQTWRSRVLNKEALKKRGLTMNQVIKSKAKMADEMCLMFPFFREYRNRHFSYDYDAFDAIGILIGYMKYAFNENGQRMICGTIEKRHATLVFYNYVRTEELRDPYALIDKLGNLKYAFTPFMLLYNPNYSETENIKMASSNWKFVITFLPKNSITRLQWQFGFKADDDRVMVAYIFRRSFLKKSYIDELCRCLPMHEEV